MLQSCQLFQDKRTNWNNLTITSDNKKYIYKPLKITPFFLLQLFYCYFRRWVNRYVTLWIIHWFFFRKKFISQRSLLWTPYILSIVTLVSDSFQTIRFVWAMIWSLEPNLFPLSQFFKFAKANSHWELNVNEGAMRTCVTLHFLGETVASFRRNVVIFS